MTFDLRRLSDPEFFAESRMAAHSDHRWFRDAAEAARGSYEEGAIAALCIDVAGLVPVILLARSQLSSGQKLSPSP